MRRAFKAIATALCCVGCFAVFNESESIVPNLVGMACVLALTWLHRDTERE